RLEGQHVLPRRHELRRRGTGLRLAQVAGILRGRLGLVLRQIGLIHRVLQPFAPRLDGADRELAAGDFHHPLRGFAERVVPAVRLGAPGTDENPVLDHDRPDADDPVRPGAGADAEDLAAANRVHDLFRESSRRAHEEASRSLFGYSPIRPAYPNRPPESTTLTSGNRSALVSTF